MAADADKEPIAWMVPSVRTLVDKGDASFSIFKVEFANCGLLEGLILSFTAKVFKPYAKGNDQEVISYVKESSTVVLGSNKIFRKVLPIAINANSVFKANFYRFVKTIAQSHTLTFVFGMSNNV